MAADPKPFVDAYKPTGFVDATDPGYKPPADAPPIDTSAPLGEEGFFGGVKELGRGLARGTMVTLPQQVGGALQFFGADKAGKAVADVGEAAKEYAPKESVISQVRRQDPLSIRGGAAGAGENLPLSFGPIAAGALAGLPFGPAGAGVGAVIGGLSALPIFYGSQGQETYKKVYDAQIAKGATEEQAQSEARVAGHESGAIEAGGELLGEAIPFGKFLKPFAKPVAGMAVKSLFATPVKSALKTLAHTELSEVATEMGQQAGEAAVEGAHGAGEGATWKDTASVIAPTAIMSLLPGGAAGAHSVYSVKRAQGALANKDADPEQRTAAAQMVSGALGKENAHVAQAFDIYAKDKIAANEPVEITDDVAYFTHATQSTLAATQATAQQAQAAATQAAATAAAQPYNPVAQQAAQVAQQAAAQAAVGAQAAQAAQQQGAAPPPGPPPAPGGPARPPLPPAQSPAEQFAAQQNISQSVQQAAAQAQAAADHTANATLPPVPANQFIAAASKHLANLEAQPEDQLTPEQTAMRDHLRQHINDPETLATTFGVRFMTPQEEVAAARAATKARTGIDPGTGPVGAAAATAVDSGAAAAATSARQAEAGQAMAEGEEKAGGPVGKAAEVATGEPAFSTVPQQHFPFKTPEGALARMQYMKQQTGAEHMIVPHPLVHDAFAVVPKPKEEPGAVQEPSTEGVGPHDGGAEGAGGTGQGEGVGPVVQGPEAPGQGEGRGPGVQPEGEGQVEEPWHVGAARELIAAVDKGGIPLNPAKLRAIAEGFGLEVSKTASPEDTVKRIREAYARHTEGEPSGETEGQRDQPEDQGDADGEGEGPSPVPAGGEGQGGGAGQGPGPVAGPREPGGPTPPAGPVTPPAGPTAGPGAAPTPPEGEAPKPPEQPPAAEPKDLIGRVVHGLRNAPSHGFLLDDDLDKALVDLQAKLERQRVPTHQLWREHPLTRLQPEDLKELAPLLDKDPAGTVQALRDHLAELVKGEAEKPGPTPQPPVEPPVEPPAPGPTEPPTAPKEPKAPKPPSDTVTIPQAKKVWEAMELDAEEAPLFEGEVWRTLDGAPHVIGKEGAAYHFVRLDKQVLAIEGFVSDKARRRARGGADTAEDPIANMIADGDQAGLAKRIYDPSGHTASTAEWPQIFPEDNLIRLDVALTRQHEVEASLKALGFRITAREMNDQRPGEIRLSALYKPAGGTIVDTGGTMAGGRKEPPKVDPGDTADPHEKRVDKILASAAKGEHSDPRQGFGSFGSFMFREAMLDEVTGPAAFIAKPFMDYRSQGKPKRALVQALKDGKLDEVVQRAQLYADRVRLLSDTMQNAATVADVAEALRERYQDVDEHGVRQQIVNPGDGTDLARLISGDLPAIINNYQTLYEADEESTDQTNRKVKKDPTVPPRLETIVRKNLTDHRGGKNIEAETEFQDVFGFRGVEFGNWVNQTERQENLNLAFDGLWDMVDALKADPLLVGLANDLGMAFGARGRGRASAHFEPSNNVINLTRHKGNGTVSHEWMHALEHHLRKNGYGTALTNSLRQTLQTRIHADQIDGKLRALLRSENDNPSQRNVPPKQAGIEYLLDDGWVNNYYNKIEQDTQFKKDAEKMDQQRGSAYWATKHELVARGYETFMFDHLKGGSPYLVGPTVADGYVVPANGYAGTSYPLGEERAYIGDQYRHFLDQIDLKTLEVKTYTPVGEVREDALGRFHVFDQMGVKYGGAQTKEEAASRAAALTKNKMAATFGPREAQLAKARAEAWALSKRIAAIMDELGIHDYPEVKNGSMSESMFYHLRNGWWPKDNNDLTDFAKQAFRVDALDDLKLKMAQEDFEAALAKYVAQRITDMRLEGGSDRAIYDYVVDLYKRQPNLNLRTTTSMANQGYSTPLPISFIGSLLARVKSTETGYDPTAGNGMFAIGANPQRMITNELEHHRFTNLQLMKYGTVHKGDALTAAERGVFKPQEADFVLMNPPFGALEKEALVDGYRIRALDQLIITQNLAALKDNGRGVLILGANLKPGLLAAKDLPFLNWLYSNYNVADHFEIDGPLYSRQGTKWPIRVLVLAGRQQSDKLAPASGTVDRVTTFDDLWDRHVQAYARSEPVLVGSTRQPGGAGSPDQQPGGVSKGGKGKTAPVGGGGGIEAGDDIIGGLFGPGDEGDAAGGRGGADAGDTGAAGGGGAAGGRGPRGGRAGGRGGSTERGGPAKGPDAGDVSGGDGGLADLTDADLDALFGDSPPPETPPTPPKGGKKRERAPKPGPAPKTKFTPGAPAEVISPPAIIEASFEDIDPWQQQVDAIVKARPFFAYLQIDPKDGAWDISPTKTLRFSFFEQQPSGQPKFLPGARGGDFLMLHGLEDRAANTYTPINQTYQLGTKGLTGPIREPLAETAGDTLIADVFGKFSLDNGPEIDNQIYAKVKPGFQQKWDSLMLKFANVKVAIQEFLRYLVTKFGDKIKPYAKAFALEMRAKDQERELNKTKKQPIREPDEPNELQAVYESRSQAPISGMYTPTSLAKDLNAGFNVLENEYVNEYPGGIDEMVQKELGYDSIEEMWWGKDKDPDSQKGLAAYQVDGVALAIARMKEGLGFINGDDTGVGKGRQAAALMHWAVKNGKIPIFFSVKPDLFSDINRDLNDIGKPLHFAMTNSDVDVTDDDDNVLVKRQGAGKAKALLDHIIANRTLPDNAQVLFTTYDQIKEENDRRKAIRHLVASGKAVIIMDEAHTASGAAAPMFIEMLTGNGLENHVTLAEGWTPPPTTYFSATFAKRPDNLPVYVRTHISLIGQTADDMSMVFSSGGPLLQQVVSKMLVRSGQMIRRERSYANLKLDWKVDEQNGPRDFRLFDQVTSVLRSVVNADRAFNELMKNADWVRNFLDQLIATGVLPAGATSGMKVGDLARSLKKQAYTSVVHNYLGQLLLATKLDASVKETVEAFNRGEKPVLALHNTMEAMLEDFTDTYKINNGDSLKNFGWNSVAQRGLNSTLRIKFKNPQGFKLTIDQPATILAMLPQHVRNEYVRAQQLVNQLVSPLSAAPIDMLRHQLAQYRVYKTADGTEQMALPKDVPAGTISRPFSPQEITGRSLSVDYSTPEPTLSTRIKMKKRTVINAFNNGGVKDKKTGEITYVDAVILNSSGSTGISLHASVKFDDQRPRRMIVLQPSPDISIFKQTIGRINRTGQVEYPFYTVFSSAVPAEKRPLAMLRKKMKSLTSNTSSASKNAADVDATDFINMYGDRVMAQYLREHTVAREFIGIDVPSDDDALPDDLASDASGRAALLPIQDQTDLYDEVEQNYAELIAGLNREGTNRLERSHYDFDAVPRELTTFFDGEDQTGNYPLAGNAMLGLYDVNIIGVPPTPAQVKNEVASALGGLTPDAVVNNIDAGAKLAYEEARNQLVIKIADYEKELTGNPTAKEREVLNRQLAGAQRDLATFSDRRDQTLRALRSDYALGHGGQIRYNDFEPYAVVTGYTVHKRASGNPFSPSNVSVHFLRNIPNGALTLRLSQLERNQNFKMYGWTDRPNIDHEFRDRNLTGGREDKYIITGNIPQALSQTQGVGEIMSFSIRDDLEEATTGLLMPRGFTPGNLATIDYNVRDPQQIAAYLAGVAHALAVREGEVATAAKWAEFRGTTDLPPIGTNPSHALAVFSSNGVVRLTPREYGGVRLQIDTRSGAKFKKDKKLAALVGQDLTGRGGAMRAEIPAARVAGVVRYLRNQMPLYVLNSVQDVAKHFRPQPGVTAKFSLGEARPGGPQNTVAGVQAEIAGLTAQWRGAPEIKVLQTVAELEAITGDPTTPANARGQFYNGAVYLVADNLAPGRAEFVVAHEALGHFGLAGLLGRQLEPMMDRLYASNPEVKRLADAKIAAAAAHGQRMSTTLATEEALSDLAAQGRLHEVSGWRLLVAAIRRALRAIGFKVEFSDADIRSLLANARRYVERGEAAAVAPGESAIDPRYSLSSMAANASTIFRDTLLRTPRKQNPVLKNLQTQFHKAQKFPGFRRVYQETQAYLRDVSAFALSAADLAQGLLPKLGRKEDVLPAWLGGVAGAKPEDIKAVSQATFAATLADMRPTPQELLSGFTANVTYGNTIAPIAVPPMTPTQADLFMQARSALDLAIDQTAMSQVYQIAKGYGIGAVLDRAKADPSIGAQMVIQHLQNLQAQMGANAPANLAADIAKIEQVAQDALDLQDQGYAPLMRFGQYTLKVEAVVNQVPTLLYFGMFESKKALYAMEREMRAQYPNAVVTPGTLDTASHKLLQGLNLSSLETFAKIVGLSQDQAYQAFYTHVVASRSALKQLIHRKGIAGYNEDLPRVLASFITSSARLASKNYHFAEMKALVQAMPAHEGDLKSDAAELVDYVQNPQEEAAKMRGYLFINFIGGSVASALTNLTQTTLMTAPWLSQYSNPASAAGRVLAAMRGGTPSPELEAALKRAAREGITEPQEIHQLHAEAIRGLGSSLWARKGMRVWSSMFALAESFNRRVTFIAAFNTAMEPGGLARINAARAARGEDQFMGSQEEAAYAFAEHAVEATQGVYNRGNRPNWARGPIGATVFTFKQFTIAYLEFLARLPKREKALAGALLLLATGLQGAPGADDLEDLIDTLGQLLGYNTNFKKALREAAVEHLGETFGGLLTHGVSHVLPFDVQARLSVSNIIPGTALFKQSDAAYKAQEIAEVLGPIGGLYKQGMAGFEGLAAGNLAAPVVAAAPIAIQNLAKGLDMWSSGVYKDSGGGKVMDVTGTDAILKGIGLQPEDVAAKQRAEGDVQQSIALVRIKESQIADKWARGILDKDPDGIQSAVRELHQWNVDNPEWPILITPYQIRRRVRDKMTERGARILKAAPREVRGTVLHDLQE